MTTVTAPPDIYYYTVNNPDDPDAVAMTKIRKAELLVIERAMPADEDFFDIASTRFALSTGVSTSRAGDLFATIEQLRELPRLHTLQHELFHLDLYRLITITKALAGLESEHLDLVDEHLTEYLTPQAPNQDLPSAQKIKKKIKAIRLLVDDDGEPDPVQPPSFSLNSHSDGTAELHATVDEIQGQAIKDAVHAHAEATGMGQGEALADLILTKIDLKVVLNLYRATDLAHAPVWMSGPGWVDEATGEKWVATTTRIQDMDKVRGQAMTGHDPSPAMRAAVKGRDGGCGAPGCGVASQYCDVDHRINFADGGPTSIFNLFDLCRCDHNAKTCERQRYVADPVSGVRVTVYADGTWAVTVPEGPLTPGGARWAQTVSQYRAARHQRARERAAAAKAKATEATMPPQEDEPPF
ncbi:HNH endonuclease signature motif containing protein [uncultured Corynebacterium sp.]|uniref:HNH endonuclease signature motif containing protein n=1 Tax=uncultured Corynebacterium sp. TaxID=159447 RepID=UPI0025FCB0EF|nr:HNH endonuclease signature motif containing protein [uncultured Corynebacterium sp.]